MTFYCKEGHESAEGIKVCHCGAKVKEYPFTYSPLQILYYNLNTKFNDPYPAKMPEDFARDMIELYSKSGDVIWDGCCGSGTVPRVANRMERDGIGSDVNPVAIDIAKRNDPDNELSYYQSDARVFEYNNVDMILSSLPFGLSIANDKNNYSDEPGDISNSKDYAEFFENTKQIIQNYYKNLKHGGVCVLDARDRLHNGKTIPLVLEFLNQARDVGFELVTRYYYELIPYRQMTYKWKPTAKEKGVHIRAMPSTMDALVLVKWNYS